MPPVENWPEGLIVKGWVVDHQGAPVADAEILLLGKEGIFVDADRRTWFVFPREKDDEKPVSKETNAKGEFTIERKKGTANRLAVITKIPCFGWFLAKLCRAELMLRLSYPRQEAWRSPVICRGTRQTAREY